MAVRVRANGEIVCAAVTRARKTDCYIHDGLHYKLSAELGVLVEANKTGTRWKWAKVGTRIGPRYRR